MRIVQPLSSLYTLVLNQNYTPVHYTTARKAIKMLVKERAEQLESDGVCVRWFSGERPCPTVIRLKRYVRLPNNGNLPFSRRNVFKRDKHTCQYCGESSSKMTIDHITPRAKGGTSTWLNTVAACEDCNCTKEDKTLQDAGMVLRRAPHVPKYHELMSVPNGVPESFKQSWERYLVGHSKR